MPFEIPSPNKKTELTGRPLELTDAIERQIIAYIRAGATPRPAAEAAGVPALTFDEWRRRGEGRDPDRPATPRLVRFAANINAARAEAQVFMETQLFAQPGPGERIKWLQAADRQTWTDRQHLTVLDEPKEPLEIVIQYVDGLGRPWSPNGEQAAEDAEARRLIGGPRGAGSDQGNAIVLEVDLNGHFVSLERLVAAPQHVVAPGKLHPVAQHRPHARPHAHPVLGRGSLRR